MDRTTVKAACSYCGVGCGMLLEIGTDPGTGARSVQRASGDREHPANCGQLFTKGATSADMLAAGGRLRTAHVRRGRGHLDDDGARAWVEKLGADRRYLRDVY